VSTPAPSVDPADDLVAGNDRYLRSGKLTVGDMKICSAHAAGCHGQPDLSGAWQPIG
jgi:hypothetical protein